VRLVAVTNPPNRETDVRARCVPVHVEPLTAAEAKATTGEVVG